MYMVCVSREFNTDCEVYQFLIHDARQRKKT